MDQDELLINFVDESQQHLQTIEPDLLEIEKAEGAIDAELINRVFRAVHSIKGAAGFFGLQNISRLSHTMENLLSLLRDGKIALDPEMIDALLSGVDSLRAMIEDVGGSEGFDIQQNLEQLQKILDSAGTAQEKVAVSEEPKDDEDKTAKTFELLEQDIKHFIKTGLNLYSIRVFLREDIKQNEKTPYDFINNMASLGQFVDAVLDIESISGLNDCLDNELAFIFIFATILEKDLVPAALELPEERVTPIDLDAYRKKYEPAKKEVQAEPDKPTAEEQADTQQQPAQKTDTDAPQQVSAPEKAARQVQAEEKIRVGVGFLNELVNLAGELVLGRNQLMQVTEPLIRETPGLSPVVQHLNRITSEMQEKIMQMRMQPVSMLFGKFSRVVRDLAKNLQKDIQLATFGEDVELDKSIIEALSDPLTHLIRNCADHAIELPEAREKAGKARRGTIELKAYHKAGQVHIEVNDDGAGVDGTRVGKKALEKGLITEQQLHSMSEKELVRLIFRPGFSTAEKISNVSGRGVGMDVVMTNIEQLGGSIDIETRLGKGTSLRLSLPLTLAIVSGLVIRAAEQFFILPEANIEELVRLKPGEIGERINYVNDAQVLRLRDMLLPLINLQNMLGLSGNEKKRALQEEQSEPVRILVTRYGASCFGLVVDSFENIEEVVVKPLPRYLKKIKCYSGASIMGNGTVALILDAAGIAEKANLQQLEAMKAESAFEGGEKAEKAETQTLLLFDNNTEERFALPLELITRIERVPSSEIEHIKDRQYLQYQGEKLRLIFLEDYLPITPPQRAAEDTVGIIIPKLVQHPMGIVINRVIDTVQEAVELDTETITAPGLFGSAVLDGKITLFPDMYRLFETAEPELYARTEHKKDPQGVKNILLVDDVAFFRMVETDYLSSAGYCVFQADSGETALRILESERVDAVVLDIVMPGMDGWQVIERIRADTRFADLPVMAVTSLGDEEYAEKGLQSGFSCWEAKLNKERMLDKLEKMLEG